MTNQTPNAASLLRISPPQGDASTFRNRALTDIAHISISMFDEALSAGIEHPDIGQCLEAISYALELRSGEDLGRAADWLRSIESDFREREWSSTQACARGLRRLGLAMIGSVDVVDPREFFTQAYQLAVAHVPPAIRAVASLQQDPARQAALNAAADGCERAPTFSTFSTAERVARTIDSDDYSLAANAARALKECAYDASVASNPSGFAAHSIAYAIKAVVYAAEAQATAVAAAPGSGLDTDTFTLDATLSECAEKLVRILCDLKAPGCHWLVLAPVP